MTITQRAPTQLRILIPIKRAERCFRVLRTLATAFPDLETEFIVLHIFDDDPVDNPEDFLEDLLEILSTIPLPGKMTPLVQRGDPATEIVLLASRLRCDLIILPVTPEPHRLLLLDRSIANRVITRSQIPVLLAPDPSTGQLHAGFKSVLIGLDPASQTRIETAFAIKMARLYGADIHFWWHATLFRSAKALDTIDRLVDRYLGPGYLPLITRHITRGSFRETFKNVLQELDPDLVIFCVQSERRRVSRGRLKRILPILPHLTIPVVIARRFPAVRYLMKKYRAIGQQLTDFDLTQPETGDKTTANENVLEGSDFFLGHYSARGIATALERYGMVQYLTRIGYPDVRIDIDTEDRFRQRLRIVPLHAGTDEALVDLVLSRQMDPDLSGKLNHFPRVHSFLLGVDWLCLQDPLRRSLSSECPLPGQAHPGLGVGWQVMVILFMMAQRMGAEGLYTSPDHYHNARLFHRYFHYIDPYYEGLLMAVDRDTFPLHLGDVSWAILHGLVSDTRTGEPFEWHGTGQILPLDPAMASYFHSPEYQEIVWNTLNRYTFKVDLDTLEELRASGRLYLDPAEKTDKRMEEIS